VTVISTSSLPSNVFLNEASDINRSTYRVAGSGLADRGVTRADVDHPGQAGHSAVEAELVK
jgi:hypothetical protein